MSKPKAIVLMSGGMDSLLITALSLEAGYEIFPLFIQYGQKTEKRELKAFNDVCDHYKVPADHRKVMDLRELGKIGGSSLTDAGMAVESELGKGGIPNSYVPFRNSIFLAYAVSWAEVLGAEKIIIGAVVEDAPGYPDCRPEYYTAFNHLIRFGAKNIIQIETPIIRMSKEQILNECERLEAPIGKTWSCYQNEDKPCGTCDSCKLRQNAFEAIGKSDPLL